MGEYALYAGREIKIGGFSMMFGLRAAQAPLVTRTPPLAQVTEHLFFRFPWPDEDGTRPGGYPVGLEFRELAVLGVLPAVHCSPDVALVAQKWVRGHLAIVVRCEGCRQLFSLPDADSAAAVAAAVTAMDPSGNHAGWQQQVAARIAEGYTLVPDDLGGARVPPGDRQDMLERMSRAQLASVWREGAGGQAPARVPAGRRKHDLVAAILRAEYPEAARDGACLECGGG